MALVRTRNVGLVPRFLAFALRSGIGQGQFKTSEYGGTKQGLGLGDVKNVFFPFPTRTKQEEIVAHIDTSLHVFDTAISRFEREITLLREYRTRLTADVVTGKLDVRTAAAHLPAPEEAPAEAEAEEPEEELEMEEVEEELA